MSEKEKASQDYPVMMHSELTAGQQMMKQFLKHVEVRIKGNKVVTSYHWEFPDEIVAKSFAHGMKETFESGE